jgi:CHASE2 domain-containing sensor protein
VSMRGGPYVGLDYFLEDDAALFFGREHARKRIIGNLRASRLTLLYAESGVGKSSLLRAGVSARMRQLAARSIAARGATRYVPVVFSAWRGDPTGGLASALEAAVRRLVGDDALPAVRRDALEHAIEDVAAKVDATLLIILDQFEEHFLYEPQDGERFDDDLARCVNRRDLRANFLIAIREDAYSLIGARFKARIPNVYGNYLRLDFLDERAAREAVLGPVKAFNERVSADAPRFEVEPALVDAVLEQVRRGRVVIGDGGAPNVGKRAGGPARVETAYLQLVMKRLWDEEVAAGSERLRLETLRRLGGADTIVRGHLDDVMATMPADQRDAVAAAFRFLVTASGRKIALSSAELREFSDVRAAPLEPALAQLERERILRAIPAEPGEVGRHEIYHDVLAPAIVEWRRRHGEEQRRAETERRLALERRRARRLEVRSRRLAGAVVALAAITVGLALYLWDPGPLQRAELQTIDARYVARGPRAPDSRVLLIAVDDRTRERLDPDGDGRIPRAAYAEILDRLRPDRPAVIALDVLFRTPDPQDPRGDRALRTAFRATRDRLVLAFDTFDVRAADGTPTVQGRLLGRPDLARQIGGKAGYAGLPDDRDGRNRRANYVVDVDGAGTSAGSGPSATAPTFAFVAADLASGEALRSRANKLPAASRRAWGDQSGRTTWIDYQGPPGTVRRVSALDLLQGRVPRGAFQDKLVVIGATGHGAKDRLATPFGGGRRMPGAEVQANALDTIVRGSPLRDVSSPVNILAILLLACLAAVAGLSRSSRRAIAAIAAMAVVYLVVAQLAFQGDRIIAVVAPLTALAVASAGSAVLSVGRTLRRRARTHGDTIAG